MGNRRTTVVLEESLYRQAKKGAVEMDKSLKEIIEEALRGFLMGDQGQRETVARPRFGIYPGKPTAATRREDLYRDAPV